MAAVIDTEDLRHQAATSQLRVNEEVESTMDDFLRQLDRKVTEIHATIPHLATKAELSALRGEMKDSIHAVDKSIGSLKTELLKWGVTTIVASIGAATAVARLFG